LVRPHIHASFPLGRTVEAMQMLTSRKVIGKMVIEP